MSEKIQAQIKNCVGAGYYSVTSDGWSQPTKTPSLQRSNIYSFRLILTGIIYSLTVHIVNEKFEREDFVLAAFSLGDDRHTGVNLASKIEIELNKHGLSTEQLVCMVRDDAKNMINTCSLLKVER
jgi:hypothetical protein